MNSAINLLVLLLFVLKLPSVVIAQMEVPANSFMEDAGMMEQEENEMPTPSSSFIEFTSNDGMTLRVATDTLLDKHAGPLDAKIRYRDSMQTTTFVDVAGSLLEAMLNYYRYDVLKCPPKERMDPTICQLAMNEYLPGVSIQSKTTLPLIVERQQSDIHVVAPSEHVEWIRKIIDPIAHKPFEIKTGSGTDGVKLLRGLTKIGESRWSMQLIHLSLIKNAPEAYRVHLDERSGNYADDKQQLIFHIEPVY